MSTLAITGGGVVGSLYDPTVWLMICLVGWIAINKVSWAMPVAIAAGFTAVQIVMKYELWAALGASWVERGLWQFWFKLVICLAVFGAVRGSMIIVRRVRTSA